MNVIWHHGLCQCLRSLQKVGVSLGSDALQTFLIHQFRCGWDLIDEKSVRKPDDVCSQCDGRNLEEDESIHQCDRHDFGWNNGKEELWGQAAKTITHLFTDIQQWFVKLLVHSPENVEVKHKQTTDERIFIPLVNLRWFTWKHKWTLLEKCLKKIKHIIQKTETDQFLTQH